jgi:iron complex outermembrane receptor protein
MRKKFFTLSSRAFAFVATFATVFCISANMQAQSTQDSLRVLEEVIVRDTRVNPSTPMTTTTISREELDDKKGDISIPYILEMQPSVVVESEQGRTGNSSMRIRGVDATRINVNINGITLNDPESQAVYWVNIPNLGGMAQNIQIQRGIGTSVGGSPALGGTISLQTLTPASDPYASADVSYGSFNTKQYGITVGSGRTKHGFAFDVAYNGFNTDGFVRNGFGDQQSLFLTGGWSNSRTLLKAIVIIGHQRTGITWNGASAEDLDQDPRYNDAGMYYDDLGNVYYYHNETDNYNQRHYQLYWVQSAGNGWNINAALDFTHGDGYDENYRYNKKPSKYGIIGTSKTDYITQKNTYNSSFTANLAVKYRNSWADVSFGGAAILFDGNHYGDVIWSKDSSLINTLAYYGLPNGTSRTFQGHPNGSDGTFQWYNYNGVKTDGSAFAKASFNLLNDHLNIYTDLQFRLVDYSLIGNDDNGTQLNFHQLYPFFNPRLGLNYAFNEMHRIYLVAGLSNREPTRSDIKEHIAVGDSIRAEHLLDIEFGYGLKGMNYAFNANAYAMLYKDQLTPNGMLSSSGYGLLMNVDMSYRIGIELEGGYKPCRWFDFGANLTVSRNKVVDYTYQSSDSLYNFYTHTGNTDLAMSPNVISALMLNFNPWRTLKIQLVGKYVGAMYVDNTSREEMKQDGYFVANAKISYTWTIKGSSTVEAQFLVNNLLDNKYRLSAWGSEDGGVFYRGYYQQPGINFMGRLIISL